MEEKIVKLFEEASSLALECGRKNAALILQMARELIRCFEQGNKLLLFGNGGSASQAQHFAAELVNKIAVYRVPLPAIALTTDTSRVARSTATRTRTVTCSPLCLRGCRPAAPARTIRAAPVKQRYVPTNVQECQGETPQLPKNKGLRVMRRFPSPSGWRP